MYNVVRVNGEALCFHAWKDTDATKEEQWSWLRIASGTERAIPKTGTLCRDEIRESAQKCD